MANILTNVLSLRGHNGIRLVADVAGPASAPTIILLHGGGQTRHSWSRTMERFARSGYRVLNLDLRGHGDSAWSADGDYSFATFADDLIAVRRATRGRVVLIGASLGGVAAFYATGISPPGFTDALIMVDIALRPAGAGAERIKKFMSAHPEGFAEITEAIAAVAAYTRDRGRPVDPEGLAKNLRRRSDGRLYWHWDPRLLDNFDDPLDSRYHHLAKVGPRVTVPTLLVRGKESDVLSDETVADMVRLVPHIQVLAVAGAGHMVTGDDNDAFSAGVLEFLARHYPPS